MTMYCLPAFAAPPYRNNCCVPPVVALNSLTSMPSEQPSGMKQPHRPGASLVRSVGQPSQPLALPSPSLSAIGLT
ncbi:MAG: hypothetical protein IPH13_21830 [Planctomycetes bacterium]|nr:hypothetical protein [Planctomycetota bacterium]